MKLDPNRDPQRFQRAVMALVLLRAKDAVVAQIRADGLKLGQFSSPEIRAKSQAYLALHYQALIPQAVADAYKYWC